MVPHAQEPDRSQPVRRHFIGGIDLALERAGVRVVATVEIDQPCRGVLARHFPQTTLFEDVTEVTGDQLRAAGFVPGRGILAGGWPCQDLSIAGRRAGLGGARSGLFWHVVRLARELRPRWLLLENVPGLLSAVCSCPGDETCLDNGRTVRCGRWETRRGQRIWLDHVSHTPEGGACPNGCMPTHGGAMGTVVGALEQLGYGLCWRVLDARFFGVPQQRERLFFAGCLGDGARPVEVLLEPEGGDGDSAPRQKAGEDIAGTLGSRAGGSRTTDLDGHGAYITAAALQGGGRRGHRIDAEGAAGGHLIAMPVALRGRAAGSQIEFGAEGDPAFAVRTPAGGSSHAMVAYALTDRNDRNDRNDREQTWVTHALTSEGADASEDGTGRGSPLVPVFAPLTSGSAAGEGVNPPGRRREDAADLAAVPIQDGRSMTKDQNGLGIGAEGGPSYTLDATGAQSVAMAFNPQTGGSKPRLGYRETPTALSCTQATGVQTATAVRRLTPKERERLQGFPDDWTRWRLENGREVEQSDAARDRQTGNAVACPVAEWIARRIAAVDAARESESAA